MRACWLLPFLAISSCRIDYNSIDLAPAANGGAESGGGSGGATAGGGPAGGSSGDLGQAGAGDGGADTNGGTGAGSSVGGSSGASVGGVGATAGTNAGGSGAGAGGDGAGGAEGGTAGGGGNTGGGGAGAGAGGTAGAGAGTAGTSAGTAGTGGASMCIPDTTCSCDTFDGHEYRFCPVDSMLAMAEGDCALSGMTLIRVDSAEENAWLLTRFSALGMFLDERTLIMLGGSDLAVDGEWRWPDGTLFWDGAAVGGAYINWENPPGGGQQNCMGMQLDGRWVPRACNSGNVTYACETP